MLEVSSSILPQVLRTLLTYIRYLLVLNKAGKRERKAIVCQLQAQSTCKWVNYTVHCSTHGHLNFVSQNQQKIAIILKNNLPHMRKNLILHSQ